MRKMSAIFLVLLVALLPAASMAQPVPTDPNPAAPPLLLTEVVVTPTGGEFVEIYNPGGSAVDLGDVYLTDATHASGGSYYYHIVTGANAGGGDFADFYARFPAGANIGPGEYQTVALNGSANFAAAYGLNPTYELYEDDGSPDAIPDMREALSGSINNQGGLSNAGEVVILHYWDGATDLVTDLDYVVWGDKVEAVDKTGISIDGPDADSDASDYLADTAITAQDIVGDGGQPHIYGNSAQRLDLNEGAETHSGGNGAQGHDETSEDLGNTWCEELPTPNSPSACSGGWIINEIHADPDPTLGDANGDGAIDASEDEFVEIVNVSGADVDISGWTLSDGAALRHTFPAGSVVHDQCAIVVFGGGAPSGDFGTAAVQTASSGALDLNDDGDTVTLNDGTSDQATATYGPEGGDNQSLTLDPDITGGAFVKHSLATGSGGALFSPGTMIDASPFAGCVTNVCGGPATFIHEVQGPGLTSPIVGQTVVVEAVVVGDFQSLAVELGGFFVQEEDADTDADPLTSEGVFVYDSGFPVDVNEGDVVRLQGVVNEYYTLTQLKNISSVRICSSGESVTQATINLPVESIDYLERYEGMWVTLPQTLYATESYNLGRYGELWVSVSERLYNPTNVAPPGAPALAVQDLNDRSRLLIDDGSTVQNPPLVPHLAPDNTLRLGDTVTNLSGALSYGYDYYRLQPTSPPAFVRENERTDNPPADGRLTVASFNVLNYFNGDGLGGGFPTPRGADTLNEFIRQRDKIIPAILDIDADVIGLMEIENDGYGALSAIQDLVDGLNDVAGAGTYALVDPGVAQIGSDAIAVGLIYKPGTVTPVGASAILDSSVDPGFIDAKNRPALAQTFEENASGQRLTVVVNHLKSKGSDCDSLGDPDTGDGQGNCNLTRTSAAIAEADWLATDPTGSGDPDFLIIGDLNAYALEDPIAALKDRDYADLVQAYGWPDAYSYVFAGQAGYLDHALANSELRPQVRGTTVWHINADEPRCLDYNQEYNPAYLYQADAYRSSDHDPVVVSLDLTDIYLFYLPLIYRGYPPATP